MNKKVSVLMSTYNGEKYLKEQLDSILEQSYKNIEIIIRDDGSIDNTVNILKEYQQKHKNIIVECGENLGYINSFFELLKMANANYYAFADQDDIWLENKIELAVNSLNLLNDSKPNMAFSNSDYYDTEMNLLGVGVKNKKYSFLFSLYECVTQGMTIVINQAAKDMTVNNLPDKCFSHEWWIYMICSSMGEIGYDDITTVKYRRDRKNVTAEGQGMLAVLIWQIKNLVLGGGIKNIKMQQHEFKRIFYNQLPNENKKIVDFFIYKNYNFIKSFKKVFCFKKVRRRLTDDIKLRILFIFGVF